ncbi:MAG TPA: SDR family oxidoreductase [Candidatus Acidoferrales bacterium]|nr:SDR family oxidoreductase [Candidatus Acidoferrales bacterium]
MKIPGKVAVVTGAGGGGQGRAFSQRLAREGASVIVSDVDERGGLETVRLIQSQVGRAAFFRADAGVESDIRALIAFGEKVYGGVDIVVNNAGPYFPDAPLEKWVETIQVNLMGTVYGTLFGIEAMRRRGGGAIVNLGSTSAVGHGFKHSPAPAYDVAKAAVARLTTTLAWLREKENIRVNCIVPDWVATDEVKAYVDTLTPEQCKEQGVPLPLTTLEEAADAVMELIRNDNLAGRVMVWWTGQKRGLIPVGDPGYTRLE